MSPRPCHTQYATLYCQLGRSRHHVLLQVQRVRSQEITIGHVPDRPMPADFLTKWIGASKLNVSVEHVTNSRHAPKRPIEQSTSGFWGDGECWTDAYGP